MFFNGAVRRIRIVGLRSFSDQASGKRLQMEKLSPYFGVRITEFDHKNSEAIVQTRELVKEHGVVVFRGLDMSLDDFKKFSGAFGTLYSDFGASVSDYLTNTGASARMEFGADPASKERAGDVSDFHIDVCHKPQPTQIAMLFPEVVPTTGGQTLFAHGGHAFARLSGSFQEMLSKLSCEQNALQGYPSLVKDPAAYYEAMLKHPPYVTPCVIEHPDTKMPTIAVNHSFTTRIMELSHNESELLMSFLRNHINSPEFCVVHQWEIGDLVVYDNYAVQHKVLQNFWPAKRIMHNASMLGPKEGFKGWRPPSTTDGRGVSTSDPFFQQRRDFHSRPSRGEQPNPYQPPMKFKLGTGAGDSVRPSSQRWYPRSLDISSNYQPQIPHHTSNSSFGPLGVQRRTFKSSAPRSCPSGFVPHNYRKISTASSPRGPTPKDYEVKRDLAAGLRLLDKQGQSDLAAGFFVSRLDSDPNQFYASPHGMFWSECTPEKFTSYSVTTGEPTESNTGLPNAPVCPLSSAIFKANPEIKAIIHAHGPASMVVAATEGDNPIKPIAEPSFMFWERIKSARCDFFFPKEYCEEVAELLKPGSDTFGVLLKNHAYVMTGRSVQECYLRAYMYEQACDVQVKAQMTGAKITIPDIEEIEYHRKSYEGYPGCAPYDGQLEWKGLLRWLHQQGVDWCKADTPPPKAQPPKVDFKVQPKESRGKWKKTVDAYLENYCDVP